MQQEGRYLKAEESLLASGPDTPGGSEGQQVSGSRPFRRVGKQARKMWEFSSSARQRWEKCITFLLSSEARSRALSALPSPTLNVSACGSLD